MIPEAGSGSGLKSRSEKVFFHYKTLSRVFRNVAKVRSGMEVIQEMSAIKTIEIKAITNIVITN